MAKQDKSAELTEYWQQRVAGWHESGQSQKAFCEANDLNFHQFGSWQRILLKQAEAGGSGTLVLSQSHSVPNGTDEFIYPVTQWPGATRYCQ